VSSGAEAKKALRDGSSSLCWFWPPLIIYTCALCRPAVCRDRAEDQGKMKTRIVQPWTPEDDDRLRKLAAESYCMDDFRTDEAVSAIYSQ
jgi:hypothetical protein